jgi:hypothetical protein
MSKLNEATTLNQLGDNDYISVILSDGTLGKIMKKELAETIRASMSIATSEQNGLLSSIEKCRRIYFYCPAIKSNAVKIATITIKAGYYNDSIMVQYDAFSFSAIFVLSINVTNGNVLFKLNTLSLHVNNSASVNVLIEKKESQYIIYLTGSYNSSYSSSICTACSGGTYFKLVDQADICKLETLSPIITLEVK